MSCNVTDVSVTLLTEVVFQRFIGPLFWWYLGVSYVLDRNGATVFCLFQRFVGLCAGVTNVLVVFLTEMVLLRSVCFNVLLDSVLILPRCQLRSDKNAAAVFYVLAFCRTLLTKFVVLFSVCFNVLLDCVTDVSKVALLTEVVFMFSVCFSVLSNSWVTDVSKVAVLTEVVFVCFLFFFLSFFCVFQCFVRLWVTDVSKTAVLTEVMLMFSECLSVLSNSVLPMCQKLPYLLKSCLCFLSVSAFCRTLCCRCVKPCLVEWSRVYVLCVFQRFVGLCVTDVSKVAVLTGVVFFFCFFFFFVFFFFFLLFLLFFFFCVFQRFFELCVTDVSKVAVLTEVVFMFYKCFSVFSDSVLPMYQKLPYWLKSCFVCVFFPPVSMFCPTLSYRCVKVALLTEVVFMFSVCFSVLSNSV